MDEDENTNTPETPTPETPAVETPAVETPAVETPAVEQPVTVPDGYVPATEVETERTARTVAETARTEAEARAVAAEARARSAEIRAVAQALGFNDPNDAALYVGADVTDIEGTLASVIEAKPYLKRAAEVVQPAPVTPTNPTNPARTETLTVEAIKSMTREQIAANWSAVAAALKAGK